jgi:hypothetical protein
VRATHVESKLYSRFKPPCPIPIGKMCFQGGLGDFKRATIYYATIKQIRLLHWLEGDNSSVWRWSSITGRLGRKVSSELSPAKPFANFNFQISKSLLPASRSLLTTVRTEIRGLYSLRSQACVWVWNQNFTVDSNPLARSQSAKCASTINLTQDSSRLFGWYHIRRKRANPPLIFILSSVSSDMSLPAA